MFNLIKFGGSLSDANLINLSQLWNLPLNNILMRDEMNELDKDGFYIHTHRARSKSYESPEKITEKDIKFIDSTG